MPTYTINATQTKSKYDIGTRTDPTIYRPHNHWLRLSDQPNYVILGGSGRDDAEGNPVPPSLKIARRGMLGPFPYNVAAGARTLSVDCKYTPNVAPRPRLIIKADKKLGLQEDVIETADAGTGWIPITASFSVITAGALLFFIEMQYDQDPLDASLSEVYAKFDNFTFT